MAKLERSITINAPVEKVFGYFDEPTNLPEIWPSIAEVRNVERFPNGGHSFRFVAKMAGLRLEGTSEDVEYVADQRVVNKTKGGLEATLTWTFQPEAGGTKLSVEGEYTLPIPVLGRVAEAFVVRMNERELELMLANLKDGWKPELQTEADG